MLTNGISHPDALAFDGPNELWVGNGSPAHPGIAEYISHPGGKPALINEYTLSGFPPEGLAFDSHGNLWAAGGVGVVEFSAASLGSYPREICTITSPSWLDGPDGLAFDSHGNLWVSNYNNRVLLEFPARSLSTSHPQPRRHIQQPAGATPYAITFDAHGNLWVADQNDKVYEYAAGTLGTTNTPAAVINMSPFITGGTLGVAFDPHGNLWVSTTGGTLRPEGMVYEYAANTLGTTNTPRAHWVARGGQHECQSGNLGHCLFAAAIRYRCETGSRVPEEPCRNNACVTT